jgi:putative FmdB family regulatory protein
MPLYSFVCKDCSEKFDLLIGVTKQSEKKVCKKCGSKNIKKVFASFSVSNKDNSSSSCPTGTCPLS